MSGVANNVKEMRPRSSSWARSRHWQLVPVCSILLTLKILLNTSLQAASTKRLELGHESKAVCSPFQRKVPFCSRRNKPREKSAAKLVTKPVLRAAPRLPSLGLFVFTPEGLVEAKVQWVINLCLLLGVCPHPAPHPHSHGRDKRHPPKELQEIEISLLH